MTLTLTTREAAAAAPHKEGRIERTLGDAVSILALELVFVLYGLIVAAPIALLAALAFFGARARTQALGRPTTREHVRAALALAVVVAALAAPAAAQTRSGLYGTVTRGPTSPVCRVGVACDEPATNADVPAHPQRHDNEGPHRRHRPLPGSPHARPLHGQ